MKTVAFFNNKGGVGKTSLVYHLACMFADNGIKVLAADLDPQANLTSMFLEEERLEELWPDDDHPDTIYGTIRPILRGIGDITGPHIETIDDNLGLLVGDLGLSNFEDKLSEAWPRCHNRDEAAFRTISAFYRAVRTAATTMGTELVLIDVGPNLGAINRSAIIASNAIVIPLGPDLFSLQGLKNLGPTIRNWRSIWEELLGKTPDPQLQLPTGDMTPIGYVVMQHSLRSDRPVKAYQRWMGRIPRIYRESVRNEQQENIPSVEADPYCLATLKH